MLRHFERRSRVRMIVDICRYTRLPVFSVLERAHIAKVLHRDISSANIMMDIRSNPDMPEALLIDWDLCKFQDDIMLGPNQRTGRSVSL